MFLLDSHEVENKLVDLEARARAAAARKLPSAAAARMLARAGLTSKTSTMVVHPEGQRQHVLVGMCDEVRNVTSHELAKFAKALDAWVVGCGRKQARMSDVQAVAQILYRGNAVLGQYTPHKRRARGPKKDADGNADAGSNAAPVAAADGA